MLEVVNGLQVVIRKSSTKKTPHEPVMNLSVQLALIGVWKNTVLATSCTVQF